MCGIAGLWSFAGEREETLRERAASMARHLQHRGPDDDGVWCDGNAGVALSFRRLAIIDLSEAGAQPMTSASGRYVIVFNGEIYNFERLRADLRETSFRGHSDTEVLLACIEEWGIERAVSKFIGMFAFALWDRDERTLTIARDRLGVKPLYYSVTPRGVAFASELKAMPDRDRIDRGAVALYTRFGYVPTPWSIYEGIAKLAPGTILTIAADGTSQSRTYWSASKVIEHAVANRFRGTEDEAIEALDSVLRDSVRLRMIADVPLGLFLSGGIDSALVAALMQKEAGVISTFTIGFEGTQSESADAAAIARHLGTRHTEQMMRATDTIDAIPLMALIYDEPMGDSSSVPTYLVSQLARGSVTVALSGDGGDEFFGGYHRYFLGQRLSARVARVPRALRRPLGRVLRTMPWRAGNRRDRARGLGKALLIDDPLEQFLDELDLDTLPVLDAPQRGSVLSDRTSWPKLDDPVELMMYLDAVGYLSDDILPKVDRASMAVSLEVREPLLDHRVIELAWSLPASMKLGDRSGKLILRRLLRKYVPGKLIDAGKRGFGLPLNVWLGGPLREWAGELIAPSRIAREGFFDVESVKQLWNGGRLNGSTDALWRLLMFQAWLDGSQR
ncbi:MAG TPA: asparagine synthase (glutamine-hydrolyzing) [Thermoanaerobaculia bacterium]